MAFESVQTRLISGKGVLQVPLPFRSYRSFILYVDVAREPKQEYLNFAYNPPKSRYGTMIFLKDNYVVREVPVSYPKQRFNFEPDVSGQTLIAVKCAYVGILQSFVNQNQALGLPVISVINSIKDYTTLTLDWDEIRVVCYADTALNLQLYAEDYAVCDPNFDKPQPPPPPPPTPPSFPPGTPIEGDISDPYDNVTNDNGNTDPYPGDSPDEPPPPDPEPCDRVRVTLSYTRFNGESGIITGRDNQPNSLQYAPIVSASVLNNQDGSYLQVRGGAAVGTVSCDGSTNYVINYAAEFNFNRRFSSVQIVSIEVIP